MSHQWPTRPRRSTSDFGPRKRWVAQSGEYEVHQFPKSTGRYIAAHRGSVLGDFRTLRAAQRACERHSRPHVSKRQHVGKSGTAGTTLAAN